MSKRKKRRAGIVSTTEVPEFTELPDPRGFSYIDVASGTGRGPDSTEFLQPRPSASRTTSAETIGRTWPDVVHPYTSNRRYLYLAVLLLIGISAFVSGHLQSSADVLAASGLVCVSWLVLWLVQRR